MSKKRIKKVAVETYTIYSKKFYGFWYKNYVYIGTEVIGSNVFYTYGGDGWLQK